MTKEEIEKYMHAAARLAMKAEGQTFPNPLVGAVIVKNGKIVGKGFHKKAGGPHAEIFALKQAGPKAKGSSLFCTLEPCAHWGRTGPCAEEIKKAGVKEIFVGCVDPNPLTKGKGLRQLRRAGIRVHVGILAEEAAVANRPFFKAMTKGLPFVTVKIAESLDGKIATRIGESKWITSPAARKYAHRQRRFFDCILTGINTVLADDPALESRAPGHQLLKVVVDSHLKIPSGARLFKTKQPVLVAAVKRNVKKERKLKALGAEVLYTKSKKGRVDLLDLLKKLNALQVRNILVEAGSELNGSFLDEHLADRAMIYIAPRLIGGRGALSSVAGRGVRRLSSAARVDPMAIKKIGPDLLAEGDLKYS